jgi:pimeloyl-ACP methyl ester carboxylesterase
MELFYKSYGAGQPLVILHGLLGAGGNWHSLAGNAFSKHFRTLAVDQRNHGRSPHSSVLDYPTMAADLDALLTQLGLPSTHLLGHSMGGKTAMQFALSYPQRVDKLVVVDIAPKPYPPHHTYIFEALRALDLSAYESRSAIDEALAREVPTTPVRQFLLKNLDSDGQGGYTWKMNLDGIYGNYDKLNAGLASDGVFDGPALFVRGGASDYVDDTDLSLIRSYFPAAELATVPGAGHWVHAEAAEAFAEVVMDFLVG